MFGFFQEGPGQPAKSNLSRPASQNSVSDVSDSMGISNSSAAEIQNKAESFETILPEKTFTGLSYTQNIGSTNPTSLVRRSSVPCLVTLGNGVHLANNLNSAALDSRNFPSSCIFEIADIASSLSGLSMSRNSLPLENITKSSLPMGILMDQKQQYVDNSRAENLINNINYVNLARTNVPQSMMNERVSLPRRTSSTTNLQSHHSPSDFARLEGLKIQLQSSNFPGLNISTHSHRHCINVLSL